MPGKRASLAERVFSKLERQDDGCLIWKGSITPAGYGQVGLGARGKGQAAVHRLMYQWRIGPIPEGLELDHLCRNRACAEPSHLEAVTRRENLLRGQTITAIRVATTHCPQGHEYTEANTYRRPGHVGRTCRTCRAERRRAFWLANGR